MGLITFASDFGTVDGYAGAVKGVIKSISPKTEIIDITHDLTSIFKTSYTIDRYYSSFPLNTIHLVVVDPTVGSGRRALIGQDGAYFFVGPDNGSFSKLDEENSGIKWYSIDESRLPKKKISYTFHGRDILGPVAALLSLGEKPSDLGIEYFDIFRIKIPKPDINSDFVTGEVVDIDKFGNLVSNIKVENLTEKCTISFGDESGISLVNTYSDVPVGKVLAYVGSYDYLEIGMNCGNASEHFNARLGMIVRVCK